KQSRPRTFSSTRTIVSPSGNCSTWARPSGIWRYSPMRFASIGLLWPAKILTWSASDSIRSSCRLRPQEAGDRSAVGHYRAGGKMGKRPDDAPLADHAPLAEVGEGVQHSVRAHLYVSLHVRTG